MWVGEELGIICILQTLSVLMVALNMIELLVGLKALPVATKVCRYVAVFSCCIPNAKMTIT